MILALCLFVSIGAGVTVGPRLLPRITATTRSPMAAAATWQFASWSTLLAALLAAASLAMPSAISLGHLPHELESCLLALRHGAPNAPAIRLLAASFVVGILTRLAVCAIHAGRENRRKRATHRTVLSLVGHRHPDLDVRVVENPTALAYCLPGRGGLVVFTSSALSRLTDEQRLAVLAHERAHLRGRHHLLLASGSLLARAFPGIRLFHDASRNTARLVEMRADDVAARGCGRRSVAEALLALSDAAAPSVALAATGVAAVQRAERLLTPMDAGKSSAIGRAARAAMSVSVYGLLAGSPVLLAIAGHAALCLL